MNLLVQKYGGSSLADAEKIKMYQKTAVPTYEPGLSELIREGLRRGNLRFLHADEVSGPLGEAILIATGTPTNQSGAVDLSQVESALSWAKEKQPESGVLVMKSTVPPGAGLFLLETVLKDTSLAYASNPEFLREGQAVEDWFHPDRIVIGGIDNESINAVKAIYEGIQAPYVITDITSAEMIKYASNAFLATKISFINEIATLCDRLGATIDDVSKGIALDPRIGSSFLRAGVGYGGSCFPKDVRALDQLALTNEHDFELLRTVIMVNNRQRLLPLYALRERFGRLAGVKVAILGLSFKPNTDDIREAPSLDLIRALVDDGALVSAYDPVALPSAEKALPCSVRFERDLLKCVAEAQGLVLITEWEDIVQADWGKIGRHTESPCFFFDGRNALDPVLMERYGFEYMGVGRGATRAAKDLD